MSSNRQDFWKQEIKRKEDNPFESGKVWKQTWEDMRSIRSDPHPKAQYKECLTHHPYWRHYTASSEMTVDDLSMILCKNVGWDLNYCGLIKKSIESDWKGSSNWQDEYKALTSCLARESKQWLHQKHDEPMYDYIWNRLDQDKKEKRHRPVFELQLEEPVMNKEDTVKTNRRKMEQNYM